MVVQIVGTGRVPGFGAAAIATRKVSNDSNHVGEGEGGRGRTTSERFPLNAERELGVRRSSDEAKEPGTGAKCCAVVRVEATRGADVRKNGHSSDRTPRVEVALEGGITREVHIDIYWRVSSILSLWYLQTRMARVGAGRSRTSGPVGSRYGSSSKCPAGTRSAARSGCRG